jgi:FKBP-type peptidyl-prolyl cis-trans isomerase
MNARERGILVGLAIVLAGAIAFILVKRGEQGTEGTSPAAAAPGFDPERLPDLGTPVRELETEGGVKVQVFAEGRGEPVGKGEAMDVQYVAYVAASGAVVDRGTKTGLVLAQGGVIDGWIQGLAGIRLREKRRLLVPSALAYGSQRVRNIPPDTDLVFDVEWVRLEIDDLKVGTGKEAKVGSKVLVHYKGTLENGKVFDSSYTSRDKQPIEFPLRRGGLIEGWVQGIPGMRVGGTRKLWIPWHLAYGSSGKGPTIGPYQNLVFVVELLDVN